MSIFVYSKKELLATYTSDMVKEKSEKQRKKKREENSVSAEKKKKRIGMLYFEHKKLKYSDFV